MLSCLTGEHFYYSICIALSARSFSDAATFSIFHQSIQHLPDKKGSAHVYAIHHPM
jgi:hypothetical protein